MHQFRATACRGLRTLALSAAAAGLLLSHPVMAQERSPTERQTLVDLAYAIGESHALRQICNGPADQYWRERMAQVTETEVAEAPFAARLNQAFNSGFAARQTQFTACGPDSRKAELVVARKGQALARRLANIQRAVKRMGPDDPALTPEDPDSVVSDPGAR
jgi:uncharacterized protein (TIGR02301 family)